MKQIINLPEIKVLIIPNTKFIMNKKQSSLYTGFFFFVFDDLSLIKSFTSQVSSIYLIL